MSRNTWDLIKLNKNFNVLIYRRGLSILIISLFFNVLMGMLIFYIYINQPERDYYATSGITSPVQLTALMKQNMSSQPLLLPDPPTDEGIRAIPQ